MKITTPDLKNKMASFQTRSFRAGGYSIAAAVVVLAIAIFANILVNALPAKYTQFDITSGQLFTISQQTETILKNLKAPVTFYWIVRDGYEDSTIEQLLKRYEALSDQVKLVKKDPDIYPTFAQQYTANYTENSVIVEYGQRFRYVDYYDIYAYDYTNYYYDGSYTVSFAGEGALTSAVDYVISENLPKLYFLTGHGESSLSDTFSTAVQRENMETAELSLLTVEAVPEDADAIMICAPTSDISREEKEMLEAWLKTGGNLFYISAPPQGEPLANLEAVMASYGVTANEGILVENARNYYAFDTPYYLLPQYGYHAITTPLTQNNSHVVLPLAQGLTHSQDRPETVTITDLLTTSNSAISKIAGWSMATYEKEEGDIEGPFSVAVAITDAISEETTSHLVWVTSPLLLDDSANQMVSGGNQDFFLNCLNWMCEQEESSLTIHTKTLENEYLTMDSGVAGYYTILIIGVIPLTYLGIGIYIFRRRKRR